MLEIDLEVLGRCAIASAQGLDAGGAKEHTVRMAMVRVIGVEVPGAVGQDEVFCY